MVQAAEKESLEDARAAVKAAEARVLQESQEVARSREEVSDSLFCGCFLGML